MFSPVFLGSSWVDYCMNRAEVNLMGNKFRLASTTRFAAMRSAYYWLSFTHIANSCNWHYHVSPPPPRHPCPSATSCSL